MRDDALVRAEEPTRKEGQIPGDFVSTVIDDIWSLDRFKGLSADILQTENEATFDTELKGLEPILNACKLAEVCDPLGIYESGSKKITIDPDKIAKCSDAIRSQGVSFCNEDLRKVVEIHEEAHALHHLAQDRLMNGEIWEDFSNTPSYLKEILAQHFTFSYCKSKPELYSAFLELESRQPVEYRLWRVFQSIPKEVLYWLVRGTLRIDKYLESMGFGVPLRTADNRAVRDFMIYALKGDSDEYRDIILPSLIKGEGRFGWSYIETANLYTLKQRIDSTGWKSLSPDEQDCYRGFLLDIKENDYVVYINIPTWGKCTLARIVGPYVWRFSDKDFNHRFPVDPESVRVFDRNDSIVHPALRARLKLQGRYWRIYLRDEFANLVAALKSGGNTSARTRQSNFNYLAQEIKPLLLSITDKIHHTHPNYDLEHLVADTLAKVPGVVNVKLQGGAGDHGADIIVTFESGLPIPNLQQQRQCLVQVKSYEGPHWDTKAAGDIERALQYYGEADMGLIISTASSSTPSLDKELERVGKTTGKTVALMIGADVAALFLRFGQDLLP